MRLWPSLRSWQMTVLETNCWGQRGSRKCCHRIKMGCTQYWARAQRVRPTRYWSKLKIRLLKNSRNCNLRIRCLKSKLAKCRAWVKSSLKVWIYMLQLTRGSRTPANSQMQITQMQLCKSPKEGRKANPRFLLNWMRLFRIHLWYKHQQSKFQRSNLPMQRHCCSLKY